jgi:hypothetical protein
VVIVLVALLLLGKHAEGDGTRIVRTKPLAFNLRYPAPMREIAPAPGELLHLQRKGLDDFSVQPLSIPPYEGDVGGALPILAARELDALKQRFPDLEPVEEGKTRINRAAGYALVFRASRKPRLYGRLVLLPEPTPGTRQGVKLLLLANPDGGADKAQDVGASGQLKTPYRSFRFGTEGP